MHYLFPPPTMMTITNIFLRFFKFLNLRRMSGAIWLHFLEKNSHLEELFVNIDIPFDCEFLVARQEDDHTVFLTEVYRINASFPIHTHHFGIWTTSSGPSLPTISFYQRRNNLQGLLFKTICPEVGQFV